ncbi:hypothetical protein PoB_004303300 [Plakobranchus ocellatus]|uniref:Uncharacterized protein n=1 Tax=Plakobranchus ocellatus TaxID=259542 RepID=A0AAV4BCG8_9GAST|nr:hypothetical protein PoB_004303300 [Plakobranchus ocellatus]
MTSMRSTLRIWKQLEALRILNVCDNGCKTDKANAQDEYKQQSSRDTSIVVLRRGRAAAQCHRNLISYYLEMKFLDDMKTLARRMETS